MSEDRRQFEREFSRRAIAFLDSGKQSHELQIIDESDGGLGCFTGLRIHLNSGDIVTVRIEGDPPRQAVVRYLMDHPRGGMHVGLQWGDVDPSLEVPSTHAHHA